MKRQYQEMGPDEEIQQSWFVQTLIQSFGSEIFEPRKIFVDEQLTARYFMLEDLINQRPWSEADDEKEENESDYFLTYSSDSRYLVRTLLSKRIFNGSRSPDRRQTNDSQELPLTYSSIHGLPISQSPKKMCSDEFWLSGEMIQALRITRYKFQTYFDSELGLTITLVVDEGEIDFWDYERSAREFRQVLIENERLYVFFRAIHGFEMTRLWETTKRRSHGEDMGNNSVINSEDDQSDVLDTSHLLSALCHAQNESEETSFSRHRPRRQVRLSGEDREKSNGTAKDKKALAFEGQSSLVHHAEKRRQPPFRSQTSSMKPSSNPSVTREPSLIDLCTPMGSPKNHNSFENHARRNEQSQMPLKRKLLEVETKTAAVVPININNGEPNLGCENTRKNSNRSSISTGIKKLKEFKLSADLKEDCLRLWSQQ